MSKNINYYAYEGNIEGIQGQVAAGVSINFQDIVSNRFYMLCLHVDTTYTLYVSPGCLVVVCILSLLFD
jgi:hypothetical protein